MDRDGQTGIHRWTDGDRQIDRDGQKDREMDGQRNGWPEG